MDRDQGKDREDEMETKTNVFSLDHLDVFMRPGATIERRDGGRHAGCWVRLANGWTLSIQWGCGNYGSNYDRSFDDKPEDATQAEIAAWKGDKGGMVTWGTEEWGDTVQGYVSMGRVQHVLDLLQEDKLMREYHPPAELRAVDEWTEEG